MQYVHTEKRMLGLRSYLIGFITIAYKIIQDYRFHDSFYLISQSHKIDSGIMKQDIPIRACHKHDFLTLCHTFMDA